MNFSGLKPYQPDHAAQLLHALRRFVAALDASDTGTGKTFVACWLARELGLTPLVVCPLSVVASWKRAAKLIGIEIEIVNYEKARGTRKKRLAQKDVLCAVDNRPLYGPFFHRLSESAWGQEVKFGSGSYWHWNDDYALMIFDEVHRCGGSTSLNSKMLIAAKRQAGRLLMLSATVADNPEQMKAVGFALGLFALPKFHWWLLDNGCTPGIHGGYDFCADPIVQEDAMRGIGEQIFPHKGSRLRKADIPGFPKTLLDIKLIHDETAKAEPLIEELEEAFRNGSGLAEMTKIRQRLEMLRVNPFVELAEDYAATSRVLLFVNFKATIHALRLELQKRFKCEIPIIDGDTSPGLRDSIREQFQNNEIPVLLLNSQAGGTGIDLHDPTGRVERTSLISPLYNAKDAKQVVGRPHRDGGAFSQQFFTYFADTLEEEIAEAVRRKFNNLDALNDASLHGVFK